MKAALICLLILTHLNSLADDRLFPVATDGKWGLVDEKGNYILKPIYDYIEFNQFGDKFTYHYKDKVGLISSDGRVLSDPIYVQVRFLNSEWVAFTKGQNWTIMKNDRKICDEAFDSVAVFDKNTFGLYKDARIQLIDAETERKSDHSYTSVELFDRQLILGEVTENTFDLINSKGLMLVTENVQEINWLRSNLRLIRYENEEQIYDTTSHSFVTDRFDEIAQINFYYFICQSQDKNAIYVPNLNCSFKTPPIQDITKFTPPFATVVKSGKTGVWNVERQQWLIQPKYDGVVESAGNFYLNNGGYYGLAAPNGTEIIPPIYDEIEDFDNVYRVVSDGLYGLVSRTGEEVMPCNYYSIRIYDEKVKCFSKDQLTTLVLTSSGNVKEKIVYDEYMSIGFVKERLPRQRSKAITFEGSFGKQNQNDAADINAFGWFRNEYERQIGDSIARLKSSWGLRFDNDSIAIKPKFKDISIANGSPFTAAYKEKRFTLATREMKAAAIKSNCYYRMGKSVGYSNGKFQLVNHEEKRLLSDQQFIAVRFHDFKEYSLAGAITDKLILINKDGKIVSDELTYISNYKEGHLIICQKGEIAFSKSPGATTIDTYHFLDDFGLTAAVDRKKPFFTISGGEWYLIDRNGNTLNKEPFQYIGPFKKNRAIVKQHNQWGVIDSSLAEVVPIVYSDLDEMAIGDEIFYHVSSPSNRKFVYRRSTGQIQEAVIDQLENYSNGVWFARDVNTHKWALVDTNMQSRTPFEFDFVFPFSHGYATFRKNGKMGIVDLQGIIHLDGFKAKKITPLNNGRFLIQQKRSLMLINLAGDTLIHSGLIKEYLAGNERFIAYKDESKNMRLLDLKLPLKLPKKGSIISVSLSAQIILLYTHGKYQLYSFKTNKFLKTKSTIIKDIGVSGYSFVNSFQLCGVVSYNGDTIIDAVHRNIQFLNDHIIATETVNKDIFLCDPSGKLLFDTPFRKVIAKQNYYLLYSKAGIGLLNETGQLILPCRFQSIQPYNSIFYKAFDKKGDCFLFDLNGNQVLGGNFLDIKGVQKNGLIVNLGSFEYLYAGYINKILSFQHIFPISSDSFLLSEIRKEGVYNFSGENIVPIKYHSVQVNQEHFQVRHFNSFGFYDQNGQALNDPMK